MHASTGSRSGNHSSSSSTASGPVMDNGRSNGKVLDSLKKGERPKTEDFLTFLCLRGNICTFCKSNLIYKFYI